MYLLLGYITALYFLPKRNVELMKAQVLISNITQDDNVGLRRKSKLLAKKYTYLCG